MDKDMAIFNKALKFPGILVWTETHILHTF